MKAYCDVIFQILSKYLRESPEIQMRRRADLAFMVQMYELAYTSYHTAKGDFGNDQAWMHYAGSLVGMQFSNKALI